MSLATVVQGVFCGCLEVADGRYAKARGDTGHYIGGCVGEQIAMQNWQRQESKK